MANFGKKILSIIGIEEAKPEEEYVEEQGEVQDDMMNFTEEDYNEYVPMDDHRDYNQNRRGNTGPVASVPDTSKVRVLIYKPTSYEDTQSIIDNLKEQKPIIVNLDELEIDVAQRILDFVSGAVYALSGNIRKAARNIFVVAPFNVDVATNMATDKPEATRGEFDYPYFSDREV